MKDLSHYLNPPSEAQRRAAGAAAAKAKMRLIRKRQEAGDGVQ